MGWNSDPEDERIMAKSAVVVLSVLAAIATMLAIVLAWIIFNKGG